MPLSRLIVAAGLLLTLGSTSAGTPEEVVRRCEQSVPGVIGLQAIESRCPGLEAALQQLGLRALLTDETVKSVSIGQLEELVSPAAVSVAHATPDPGHVSKALRDAGNAHESTWWERLRDWLYSRLNGGATSSAAPAWLRWLGGALLARQALLSMLMYGLLALMVLAALALVYREIRDALPGSKRGRRAGVAPADGWSDEELTQAQISAAPLVERPRLWFRLLMRAFIDAGQLPDNRSLTHREILRHLHVADERQAAAWRALSSLTERQLFAPQLVRDDEIALTVEHSEALYESIANAHGAR